MPVSDDYVISQVNEYGEEITPMTEVDDYADPPFLAEIEEAREALRSSRAELTQQTTTETQE